MAVILASKRARLLMCGSALATFSPALALAQPQGTAPPGEEQSSATEATSADDAAAADEILVTAQRRSERLEDVPMSISVVSGDTLARTGVVSFQDLGTVVAGAQINFAGAFTQPSVRGVTTLTNGNNVENNVAVYVDGFYEPQPLITNADLPNIANIEVLKGPQGTLYGRNATGGAILINTLAPSNTPTANAEITYARFNDKRARAYVSGPITEALRVGVSGYYRQSDSYVKLVDPFTGREAGNAAPLRQAAVRAKLEADLAENLQATLGYNYVHVNDSRTVIFSAFENTRPLPAGRPPFTRAQRYGTASYNHRTTTPVTQNQTTLKLAWDTTGGTLTSYTGYQWGTQRNEFDSDGTYIDVQSSINGFRQKTFQQAIDYNVTALDNLSLIIGGLYYRDNIDSGPEGIRSFTGGPDGDGPLRTLNLAVTAEQDSTAWAAYADATYQISEALSINLGGRYSHEKKEVSLFAFSFSQARPAFCEPFPAAPAVPTTAGCNRPVERSATWSRFTPRASIRYEVAPRTNLYATYSRGFRSGQFPFTPTVTPADYGSVRPEAIEAFEVGFKTANRLFRFDLAGFYYNYTDLHVSTLQRAAICPPEPAACGLNSTVFQNAEKARIKGIDGQVSATPIENLNLRAGFAWLDAEYTNFRNATGLGLDAATNLNIGNQRQDWSGQQMARAPKFSGNAGFDYRIPVGEGGLLFTGQTNFTSSYVVNNASLFGPQAGPLANRQRFRQDGYALLHGSVTWTDPTGTLYLTVFGRNLTDKTYKITFTGTASIAAGSLGGSYGALAEPRTYGVKLGFRY